MRRTCISLLAVATTVLTLCCCRQTASGKQTITFEPPVKFNPPGYVCYLLDRPVTIDGKLSPGEWDNVPWTADFIDIEGENHPAPHLQTRVKMAYDDGGMYFAALLEEPHVWGTVTQHDDVIFRDNDFEIFLNPSNDTHNYLEYEVNALGTVWDLYISKPYRDHAVVLNNWEFAGMQSAVHVDGTVNNPNDTDRSWSVEVFIPWESIYQPMRLTAAPSPGEHIRVNFSRVQWTSKVEDGKYVKTPIAGEDKIREYNWVWAPTGVIDIHRPEFWGFVQFSGLKAGEGSEPFTLNREEETKWMLRNLYYRQKHFHHTFGSYATSLADLQAEAVCSKEQLQNLEIHTTPSTCEIIFRDTNETWRIHQDGLVRKSREAND